MSEIVLTDEQAEVLAGAKTAVVVRTANGITVGTLDPREAEIITEARKRLSKPGRRFSGVQIQARLQALHAERDRIGPFDADYAKQFLNSLEMADPLRYGPREPS